MGYQESTHSNHIHPAANTIRLLLDEGYDLSDFTYDEVLQAFCFNRYGTLGEAVTSLRQRHINERFASVFHMVESRQQREAERQAAPSKALTRLSKALSNIKQSNS